MQPLPADYLAEISRQFAFLSAFLGGFAATFLATVLVNDSPKRVVNWVVGGAALAACGFIVAVIASVMLNMVLHPGAPLNVREGYSVEAARAMSALGFGLGVYALLVSVGLSGWIRSRKSGITTTVSAAVGLLLVTWAFLGFG